jgi:hypothetical protein
VEHLDSVLEPAAMVERQAPTNLEVRLDLLVAESPREPLADGVGSLFRLPDRSALAREVRDLHRHGAHDLQPIADVERHSKGARLHAGAEDNVHDREAHGHRVERIDPNAVLGQDLLGGPLLEPKPSEAQEQAVE